MLNQQWILIADRTKVLSASSSFLLSDKKMYDADFFGLGSTKICLFITRHILMTTHNLVG
jgi:hypothetical protein